MTCGSKKGIWLAVGVFSLSILFATVPAEAARGRNNHRWEPRYHRHHPYYGGRVSLPELIAKVIVHTGLEFYYHHGYFYRRTPSGYVIVDAPAGAVVTELPPGYKVVVVRGHKYYYYNDVYYLRERRGYVVVEDPVYQIVELPEQVKVIEPAPRIEINAGTETPDSFTVNIPNSKGTYTPVVLERSGDGFTGPQGEYYPEFPSVAQLRAMYDK